MRHTRIIAFLAALTVLLFAADSYAHGRSKTKVRIYKRGDSGRGLPAESYTTLKFGGYDLNAQTRSGESGSMFFGAEWGFMPSENLQVGMFIDWLRRRNAVSEVYFADEPFDLPVENRIDLERTETDLVPLGMVLRLRMPVGDQGVTPFVAGAVSYDILRMHYAGEDYGDYLETTEYFGGWGGTLSGGLEYAVAPAVSLMGEVGFHSSRPHQHLDYYDGSVRAEVDAGGSFARFGLSLRYP